MDEHNVRPEDTFSTNTERPYTPGAMAFGVRPSSLICMAATVTSLPPVGCYLASEVGRLAGVSGDRIGQWARRGYIKASQSTEDPHVYSYQDVAEAMVVNDLIQRGVSLRKIRHTIETLREEYGDWPLTMADLFLDNDTKTLAIQDKGQMFEASRAKMRLQGLYEITDLQRVAIDLRRGGWAARNLPDLQFIEVDPNRLSGRPTIKGRRVEAEMVAELAQRPGGRKMLKGDYDLSDPEIDDAVAWWDETRKAS